MALVQWSKRYSFVLACCLGDFCDTKASLWNRWRISNSREMKRKREGRSSLTKTFAILPAILLTRSESLTIQSLWSIIFEQKSQGGIGVLPALARRLYLPLCLAEALATQGLYEAAEQLGLEIKSCPDLLQFGKLRTQIVLAKIYYVKTKNKEALSHWHAAMAEIAKFRLTRVYH